MRPTPSSFSSRSECRTHFLSFIVVGLVPALPFSPPQSTAAVLPLQLGTFHKETTPSFFPLPTMEVGAFFPCWGPVNSTFFFPPPLQVLIVASFFIIQFFKSFFPLPKEGSPLFAQEEPFLPPPLLENFHVSHVLVKD